MTLVDKHALTAALAERDAARARLRAAVEGVLDDPETVKAIKWRLDHYGPRDAEPFQYSRFESEAHAALDPVAERLRAALAATEDQP